MNLDLAVRAYKSSVLGDPKKPKDPPPPPVAPKPISTAETTPRQNLAKNEIEQRKRNAFGFGNTIITGGMSSLRSPARTARPTGATIATGTFKSMS